MSCITHHHAARSGSGLSVIVILHGELRVVGPDEPRFVVGGKDLATMGRNSRIGDRSCDGGQDTWTRKT